jgi:hypothetical protein
MSAHHNPRIVTDGLVFAYDMNNAVKSWKGKPTENLVPDPLFTQQNWSTWSGRGADSWSYDTFSGETTVYTDLSINTGERHQLYKDITVSSSLTTFALSIDVYVTPDCDANSILANQEYPFGNNYGSLGYDLTKKGTWQRLYAIRNNAYSGDTSNIKTRYRFYFGTSNTTGSQGKIYFKNAQLEEGTFATPFVNGTRSNTQALLDMSKSKNIVTATSLTYNSDGTFEFDGTDDYIQLPTSIQIYNTSYTIEAWINPDTATGEHGIIGDKQYDWFGFRLNSSNKLFIQHAETNTNINSLTGVSNVGTSWAHVAVVFDIDAGMRLYLNGELDASNTNTFYFGLDSTTRGPQYIGRNDKSSFGSNTPYFDGKIARLLGYTRALTAAEIKQNFNATRKRFGI